MFGDAAGQSAPAARQTEERSGMNLHTNSSRCRYLVRYDAEPRLYRQAQGALIRVLRIGLDRVSPTT
jgi:hypothetical protein